MKKFTILAVAALSLAACRENDSMVESSNFAMNAASAADYNVSGLPVTTVSGNITSNTTWSGVVELDGIVRVKDGATLTIQPGTFIKAKPHADTSATGVLVVTKTGKINAVGTATQPIVFTSYNLLDNNSSTTASPKDFGGVILLGDAPVNTGVNTNLIEGIDVGQTNIEEFHYGGSNAAHNAGSMQYVRIEYAGRIIGDGNEINGLTCGGVGSGTTLDHIQVSYGADDAFEFFGGTVNASNIIAFAQDDDGFDFDLGYTGTINNALALADINSSHAGVPTKPDSNGIELDNNAAGAFTALLTHPTINNLTIVGVENGTDGNLFKSGILVRRHGQLTLNDAVVTGYPTGIKVEGTGSQLFATNSNLVKAHGFTTAATGAGTANIPAANLATGTPAASWGMDAPFFNGLSLDLSPRNSGDFQGTWTKYDF
ncbi:hypothetical protein [Chryseobacterium taklimakanense]|uniref:T9SS C-terminal target domain-containing protein n=1 Tax=Chryseobacterium taklimakanense TaxID=536441 RepID=A0A3G8WMG9_9FLAO|nr:hypothetical protein [Chryseobacterium taklimakanense]AZI20677.1 hypothetical protein EIH08_08110 [Chryseobacterium taklimakanense]